MVASVGTYSGPAASSIFPMTQGAQVWVTHINKKGGLNGHQVKYVIFDDGADPARHRAQVQEAIERHGAIAFLVNGDAIAGQSSVEYITRKRVPVVGLDTGEQWAYQSPMYFPQATSGHPQIYSIIAGAAQQAIPSGKVKLGTLVCAEAQLCRDGDRIFGQSAKALGFDHVYRGTASIAQPDFTAECLSAARAGVEALIVVLDQNSSARIGASCARQNFRPAYFIPGPVVADRMKDDPNLEGIGAASQVFPYFQTGTPATDEFSAAMRESGKSVAPGVGPAVGWVGGKLLERAAANLPDPPTSEAILTGLWSIHNDTLGGLTHPLTFVRDQTAPQIACWFNIVTSNGRWTSPDGYELRCAEYKS